MEDFKCWYILKGKTPVPVTDVLEWGVYIEKANRKGTKHVSRTNMGGGIIISTVFLGIDHGWGNRMPVLFETMVFEGRYDGHQLRYTSWDDAIAGHVRVVVIVKATIVNERLKRGFKCQRMKVSVAGKMVLY